VAAPLEFVWVVRRRDLFPHFSPQGFLPLEPAELEERFLEPARTKGFFVERRAAETCPAWKQVIPYCVVRFEGRYMLMERLTTQGEARLHGKLSIGVGGHINPEDLRSDSDLVVGGALRELHEELEVGGEVELRPIGLLNDDGSAVGAVHVGIVFGVRSARMPHVREADKMTGALTPLADLRAMCQTRRPFESWSREILRVQGWEQTF
jgi:predicted NUDIX family phosphoesterase